MSIATPFLQYEAVHRARVMVQTWGHLVPKTRTKYNGWIMVAVSSYGQTIIIDDDFTDLRNSPWQYDDFQDFIFDKTKDFETGVYKFKGSYMKYKNGGCKFHGVWEKIDL